MTRGWLAPALLLAVSALAQKEGSAPRAADGKPDLTGVWQGGSERPWHLGRSQHGRRRGRHGGGSDGARRALLE